MEQIDRLGWAAGLSIISYGLSIGIRVTRPESLDAVAARLPPGWRPSPTRRVERLYSLVVGSGADQGSRLRRFNVLYGDAVRLARSLELSTVLDVLEADLQLYVADRARRRLFVHAGVVGWRGRAIVMPGRTRTGKSTLVAALVRAGATYYSDEYAVLDGQGRVHAYPRALSLRDASGVGASDVEPEVLGGTRGVGPLPVGLVVSARYRPGARWRPRRLSRGQAGIELLAHTVSARRDPRRALGVLTRVLSGARVLKGVRGEAADVIDEVVAAALGNETLTATGGKCR